jgi:hypothetical protein
VFPSDLVPSLRLETHFKFSSLHIGSWYDSIIVPLPTRPAFAPTSLVDNYNSQLAFQTHQLFQRYGGSKLDQDPWQSFWGILYHAEGSHDQPEGLDFESDVAYAFLEKFLGLAA